MAAIITTQQAIGVANKITMLMQQLASLRDMAVGMNNSYTDNAVGGILAALPTVPLTAEGGFGTPDASPVTGDTIYDPTSTLNLGPTIGQTQPMSSYNYGAALNLLQQVLNLTGGQAVATQSGAPNLLALFRP